MLGFLEAPLPCLVVVWNNRACNNSSAQLQQQVYTVVDGCLQIFTDFEVIHDLAYGNERARREAERRRGNDVILQHKPPNGW
jgi:hypothetical protein